MPTLPNARHEMFAQECAAGKNTNESYVLAGFASNRSNANNLRRKKAIATRIAELLEQRERKAEKAEERAIERAAITKEKVLSELAKIGFANMMDYMKIGPSGDPVLDYSALTRDQAAALVEVTVEDFKDGRGDDARDVRRVKFKLADKKSALIDLGKELGLFIERRETGKPGEFASLKDDEVQREIRDELRRAGISDSIAHALARGEETAGSEPERG